ncbi:MAG: hypothetical protein R3D00_23970 [Bacteroidia bacterium]
MTRFILISLFASLAALAQAQPPAFPGQDPYRKSIHAITDPVIGLVLAWEKSCILGDKNAEARAYEVLKQESIRAIRSLHARGRIPFGDPGYFNAAMDLLKYVHKEVNLTIAEIHDNPPSLRFTARENEERYRDKRTDVVTLMRAEEERFLFMEAYAAARFDPSQGNGELRSAVLELLDAGNQDFPGYKGDFRGTGNGGRSEYQVTKTLPGALRGICFESENLPGVEYVMAEYEDSTQAALKVHEISKEILSTDLPKMRGVFEYRVANRALIRESPNLHLRYQIYHEGDNDDLAPCRFDVFMHNKYGKYAVVLVCVRFK